MWGTLIIASAALLLVGCEDRKSAARIEQLERRVAALETLEARLPAIDSAIARVATRIDQASTNLNRLGAAVEIDVNNLRSEMQIEVAAQFEVFARTNRSRMPALAQQVRAEGLPKPKPVMKNGVPSSVYDEIASEARRRYPADYDMQDFVIQKQVDAYLKLQSR